MPLGEMLEELMSNQDEDVLRALVRVLEAEQSKIDYIRPRGIVDDIMRIVTEEAKAAADRESK